MRKLRRYAGADGAASYGFAGKCVKSLPRGSILRKRRNLKAKEHTPHEALCFGLFLEGRAYLEGLLEVEMPEPLLVT